MALADAIRAASGRYNLDPDMLTTFARIESGGNPNLVNKYGYTGAYQMQPSRFRALGGQDINDPNQQADIAAREFRRMSDGFTKAQGRAPQPHELYLMHQQGEGGAAAHFRNPNAPAWQNMLATAEGRNRPDGPDWARRAIWGNVPDDAKARFGSVDNMTSADFVNLWKDKYSRLGGASAAPNVSRETQAASGSFRAAQEPQQETPMQPMGFMPQLDPAAMQQQPGQQQGGFGGYLQGVMNNPLFMMGAGVLGSQNVGQGLMGGMQMAQAQQQQAYERQRQQAADQRTNAMHPLQMQLAEAQIRKANAPPSTDDINEYEYDKKNGGNPGPFNEWLARSRAMKQGGIYGQNGQIVQDKDGNQLAMQFGRDGSLKVQPITGPGGVPLTQAKGIEKIGDTIVNKSTGQELRNVGGNISGEQVAKETGEAKGKFIASLPKLEQAVVSVARKDQDAVSDADRALAIIDSGGVTSWMGATAKYAKGTPAFELAEILKSVKARAGFDTLGEIKAQSVTGSGLGATSDKELEFLQASNGSFEQAQSADALKRNLLRYRERVAGRSARLQAELEQSKKYFGTSAPGLNPAAITPSQGAAPAAVGGGQSFRYNPQSGQLEPM